MSCVWDKESQTYHGGQEWRLLKDFVEDFSVTTNALGIPQEALKAAQDSLSTILHYPAADFEPALSKFCSWLWPEADIKPRTLLGNGASELLDLITRLAPAGAFQTGPHTVEGHSVQYREYQRAAEADRRTVLPPVAQRRAGVDPAPTLTAIINPSNPTGDYLPLPALQQWILDNCPEGSFVMVDESMLPWQGPDWRASSLVSAAAWLDETLRRRRITVFVVHSWTKIWNCAGLRLGSAVAPSAELAQQIKRCQCPWSVNTPALAFLEAVVRDTAYLEKTWSVTSEWRADTVRQLSQQHPTWVFHGEPWLSWLWVDTGSAAVAEAVALKAREFGVPVRPGTEGYACPRHVRIAVRHPRHLAILVEALASC